MPGPQMKRIAGCVFAVAVLVALRVPIGAAQGSFTLEQVLGVPFNSNLVAAESGHRIAWTSNRQGRRNIWVAEGPNFVGRQLTAYAEDDGGSCLRSSFRRMAAEQLVFPDEVHDFLLYRSWLKALQTSGDYLDGKLGATQK